MVVSLRNQLGIQFSAPLGSNLWGTRSMPLNLDRNLYLVIANHPAGAYVPEHDVCEMDRGHIVKDIAEDQFSDVAAVIEFNPAEHSSRNVTEDIALEVMQRWADAGEPLQHWQIAFVETHISVQAANEFRRAA